VDELGVETAPVLVLNRHHVTSYYTAIVMPAYARLKERYQKQAFETDF
jgi:hypothetical protein